tara:strand:- start:3609 stop:4910 length:1302 start_codon:yes stop_codon:yes gene_type:complete
MYEITLGRNETDRKKLGTLGTIPIGKHYITMERDKSLANPILLDVNKPHAILVAGKRGSGKSYTLGVIMEGMSTLQKEISQNLATIIFDTMGIYWTMKYPNFKDDTELVKFNLKPEELQPVIFVPTGKFNKYQEKNLPIDKPFAIRPSDVSVEQWSEIFGIEILSPEGLLLERAIESAKEENPNYSMKLLVNKVLKEKSSPSSKEILKNRLNFIKKWGIFDEKGTPFEELIKGGQISIIDLSAYAEVENGNKIKALVIGLLSSEILKKRMDARKDEELKLIKDPTGKGQSEMPMLWMFIDEAHEFLPKEGQTAATFPLIELLREGRQPGISLVLATQQPGQIHTDVMTQSDIIISHRVTSNFDVTALNEIMQTYTTGEIQKYLDNLPRVKGSAIVLDDTNEKIFPIQIRPRISWHGGGDPTAIRGIILDEMKK